MIYEAIKNFPKQFSYEPVVENAKTLAQYDHIVVAGMGGSALAADILKAEDPALNLSVHRNYDLPPACAGMAQAGLLARTGHTLVIASSYSGNTEETLDAFREAGKRGLGRAALCTGGTLLAEAEAAGVPFVQIPDTGIQPRSALGFMLRALLALLGDQARLRETAHLASVLDAKGLEERGKALALRLAGSVPLVYSSAKNMPIAYNWKIKFNETGKIPAFFNIFPELNHNEMTGFDGKQISPNFLCVLLKDPEDDSRIQKRMDVLAELYSARGVPCESLELKGDSYFEKVFSSLLLADWTSYFLAGAYGVEAEQVPMVEEFKKRML